MLPLLRVSERARAVLTVTLLARDIGMPITALTRSLLVSRSKRVVGRRAALVEVGARIVMLEVSRAGVAIQRCVTWRQSWTSLSYPTLRRRRIC